MDVTFQLMLKMPQFRLIWDATLQHLKHFPRERWRPVLLSSVTIFLIAFGISAYFRRPYMWEWDSFGYCIAIVQHDWMRGLGVGRLGFILWCIPFWELCHLVLGIDLEDVWRIVQSWLMLTAAAGIVGVYHLGRVWGGALVGWTAALVLCVSMGWSSYSSEPTPDVSIACWTYVGLAFLVAGLQSGNLWLQIAGAACCGFGVSVKETAVTTAPGICCLLIALWPRQGDRRSILKRATLLGSVYVFFSLACPFWILVRYGPGFLTSAPRLLAPDTSWPAILERAVFSVDALKELLGWAGVGGGVVGLICLCIRRRWWEVAFALGATFIPAMFYSAVGFKAERYIILSLPPIALLCGVAVRDLTSRWSSIFPGILLMLGLVAACWGIRFSDREMRECRDFNWNALMRKNFAERIYSALPEDSIFILGWNTPIAFYYQGLGLRPQWLTYGWLYPEDVATPLNRFIEKGHRVFIFPRGVSGTGHDRELGQVKEAFDLQDLWLGISEVLPKKSPATPPVAGGEVK